MLAIGCKPNFTLQAASLLDTLITINGLCYVTTLKTNLWQHKSIYVCSGKRLIVVQVVESLGFRWETQTRNIHHSRAVLNSYAMRSAVSRMILNK